MRRSTSAVAASAFVALFAALAVRCGGGGDITPTPLALDVVPSASVSGPLPPLVRPECIPKSPPADGIGPCGCPNDSPDYSDDDLSGDWHGEYALARFLAEDAAGSPTHDLWGAGACPCKFDLVAASRRSGGRTPGDTSGASGYLVGKLPDDRSVLSCKYRVYVDQAQGCGGP